MPQDDLNLAPSAAQAEADLSAANAASLAAEAAASAAEAQVDESTPTGDTNTSSPPEESAKSLLDGVSDVLKKAEPQPQEAEEAGSEKPDADAAQKLGAEKPQAEAQAEDEGKDDHKLPFHKHPRFQQVIRQRREALKEADGYKQQLAAMKPLEEKAQKLDHIGNFLATQRLNENEFAQGMEIMAAMKSDPLLAMELLRPHLDTLRLLSGEILPPDVQARVESGEVDEQTAKELVQTRVRAAVASEQTQAATRAVQAQQAQAVAVAQQSTVAQWEQKTRLADPDYAAKEPLIIELIRARQATQPARTPEEAIAIAQAAYDRATALIPKAKPVATKPTPSSSASLPANRQSAAKPASLYDGVDSALRIARGGV